MTLREYLDQEKLTITAFAAKVGVSHAAIVRYINGTRRPEWPVIDRIVTETAGSVTPNDLAGPSSQDAA